MVAILFTILSYKLRVYQIKFKNGLELNTKLYGHWTSYKQSKTDYKSG